MQADNRAIHAVGGMPLNVITANSLQTPEGVLSLQLTPAKTIEAQIFALFQAYPISSVKIGMLGGAPQVQAVVESLKQESDAFIVLDPVIQSSSGSPLLDQPGLSLLNSELLPLVDLVTPNTEECKKLKLRNATAVLYKGGHSGGANAVDKLVFRGGQSKSFSKPRVDSPNLRGTGCTLSSAIAAYVALGDSTISACERAKNLLDKSLHTNADLKFHGEGPAFISS